MPKRDLVFELLGQSGSEIKGGKDRGHVFIPQKVADRLKEYIRENAIQPDQRIFPISYEEDRASP